MFDTDAMVDVLAFEQTGGGEPSYRIVEAGEGEPIAKQYKEQGERHTRFNTIAGTVVAVILALIGFFLFESLFMTIIGIISGGSVVVRTHTETTITPTVVATEVTVEEAQEKIGAEVPLLGEYDRD